MDSAESTHDLFPIEKHELIATAAMVALVVCVCIRALSAHEPFPMWDSDPYRFASPLVGLTAGYGILLNGIMMCLGSLVLYLTLCARAHALSKAELLMHLLVIAGLVGISIHALSDPESLVNGSALGAMMTTLVAARNFLSIYTRWVSVLVPVVMGISVMLALYGLHQVYVQHPLTEKMYLSNKRAFLESRGWTDGSFEVQSYERRLFQPEPTGWFSLANVYASFIACFAVGACVITLKSLRNRWWMIAGLLSFGLLAVLLLTKSKGAIGAAGLGGACVLCLSVLQNSAQAYRKHWILKIVIIASMLTIAGVIAGAVAGQLSLLFRGQYIVGALRIFADSPLIGAGPNGFQDAYMVHKPSTSPEDVTSAHNLIFDLIAQLGITGFAWIGSLILILWTAGSGFCASNNPGDQTATIPARIRIRMVPLIVLAVGLGAIRLQTNAMDVDLMIMLLIAVTCWMLISTLVSMSVSINILHLAMLGSAITLGIHGLLDLTPVWLISAPLSGLAVGMGLLSAEPETHRKTNNVKPQIHIWAVGIAITILVAAVSVSVQSLGVINRDRTLIAIAANANELSDIRAELAQSAQMGSRRIDPVLGARIEALTGSNLSAGKPSANGAGIDIHRLLYEAEINDRLQSSQSLVALANTTGGSTLRTAALEQSLRAALAADNFSDFSGQPIEHQLWESIELQSSALIESSTTFSELKWAGDGLRMLSEQAEEPQIGTVLLNRAYQTWELADGLNPHDPKHALRLMDLATRLDDQERAERWAQEALDRSSRMRLDPLKQLRNADLERARAILGL